MSLVLSAAWYGFSYKRDWFYFYARQDSVVRRVDDLGAVLERTGIGLQTLGQISYGTTSIFTSTSPASTSPASLPLWVLRQPAAQPAAKTICLMAGLHGNEPAGIQALRWPPEWPFIGKPSPN